MGARLHGLSAYQYDLPDALVAQYPCYPRDASRLMVIDRQAGTIEDRVFSEIGSLLQPEDHLIFNDTRVIPARLLGVKPSGGEVEIFLTEPYPDGSWIALARPGRRLKEGAQIHFGKGFSCEVIATFPDGRRQVRFDHEGDFYTALTQYGQTPLPHYIQRAADPAVDAERYQTVYAAHPGAVAAPTAGLHFTQELLGSLADKGIAQTSLTLHVGLGTFLPVQTDDIRQHKMHTERFLIADTAAQKINEKGRRKICVGTTCCRALEAAAISEGKVAPGAYETSIFIYPGYSFKVMEALLTNFHLPGSTLLMLVSAFAGYDLIMEAYAQAVRQQYRFYSYGDAMLIL